MSESRIPSHRRDAFKNASAFKADEVRRRREEQSVEIRKQKRQESLAKRRNLNIPLPEYSDSEEENVPSLLHTQASK
jgi:importin subunit alpha-1